MTTCSYFNSRIRRPFSQSSTASKLVKSTKYVKAVGMRLKPRYQVRKLTWKMFFFPVRFYKYIRGAPKPDLVPMYRRMFLINVILTRMIMYHISKTALIMFIFVRYLYRHNLYLYFI